jgi:ribonuclease D
MTYLDRSREPLRPVVDTAEAFQECLSALRAGTGPVAFDTERAHGHRYWPKAYLLQIRREGAGTWLIDPVAFEGTDVALGDLVSACGDEAWLIHAASQDLPCMRELGIVPRRIFDTELAARLLGKPGAALGALLHSELGILLRKAHSADNWSKRPLPEAWLTYAALDVDFLAELAETLAAQVDAMGRTDWVEQECIEELERYGGEPVPRVDPWRRLSGVTTLRTALQLAVARALWQARDAIAQRRDRPPSWILPDAAIIDAATAARDAVPTRAELSRLRGFAAPPGQRNLNAWLRAIDEVRDMDPADYPARRLPSVGVPNPRSWDRIDPAAAARWAKVRPAVDVLACDLGGLQPSLVAPPQVLQEALFHHARPTADDLLRLGARPWQVEFLAPLVAEVLGG